MLKRKLDKIDDLPDALKEYYVEADGGGYVLQVDDAAGLKTALEKERETARSRQQQLEELQSQMGQFKGIDPEKYKQLVDMERKAREDKLIDAGKIDELVEARVAEMRKEYEEKVANITGERDTHLSRYKELMIDSTAREAFLKAGGDPKAVKFAVMEARERAQLDEKGNVVVMKDGKPAYNADGNPSTIEDLIATDFRKQAPFAFLPSIGGGAQGSQAQGGAKTVSADSFLDNLEDIATGKAVVQT